MAQTAVSAVSIDLTQVHSWDDFHDIFEAEFGFPGFYGRNMNAWIDCMSYLDDNDAGMTTIKVSPGDTLTLKLVGCQVLRQRNPEIWEALVDCTAFVNLRLLDAGRPALIALAYHD